MLASKTGIAAVRNMPRGRVIPESDGPFGKIGNQSIYPWDTSSIIPRLAVIWKEPEEQVRARIITAFKEIVAYPSQIVQMAAE